MIDASKRLVTLAVALVLAACHAARQRPLADVQGPAAGAAGVSASCLVGAYRLADGTDVDVGPDDDAHLRWRRPDGTTGRLARDADGSWTSTLGWTGRPGGIRVVFGGCEDGAITFGGVAGTRLALDAVETRFAGAGVALAGRLVLPRGDGPVPIVVLVHGSERRPARDFYFLQRLLPAMGVGAFVYDKRGTGASGGRYSHDYLLLAEDAVAAAREARRLAGGRAGRVGYLGTSEGGWVAPLAARLEAVDFVMVGYGLAVSPLDEDREAIALDLTRRGLGPEVVASGMEIADATAAILLSGFREGWDGLARARARYGAEPWFRHVRGNVTFLLLERPEAELRAEGPALLAGLPLQHDPLPVLRNLDVPQLWMLGEDDLDAPSAETARRLAALAAAGRPVTAALFPRAEHGLLEYEVGGDGARISTRYAAGYFPMIRDYALRGRLTGPYGASAIRNVPPSGAPTVR
jgi:dienelactone hydrolase